jgi:hypothetical protein
MGGTWFDPDQLYLETALRGRAARRARALVRRRETVLVEAPRWSDPGRFLEDLALDLAVSEPAIGCRRTSLRHLRGAPVHRARQELLRVMTQLARPTSLAIPPVVADRRGFRNAVVALSAEAEQTAAYDAALFLYDCENLPFEVAEDFIEAWCEVRSALLGSPRVSLLVAGALSSGLAAGAPIERLDLSDYGEGETAAELVRGGPVEAALLASAAKLSGGVPALVAGVERLVRSGRFDGDLDATIARLGGVAGEIRGAVDIAAMDDRLAARLAALAAAPATREDEDTALVHAGLARFRPGARATEIRTPLIARLV